MASQLPNDRQEPGEDKESIMSQPSADALMGATSEAEPAGQFTPGPWHLEQPETWPFDLQVLNPKGEEVISARRWAHASGQKSVAECLRAEGFEHQARRPIIETLAQQVATLRLIAAAPDLLRAAALLEAAEDFNANDCRECDGEGVPELCPVCFPKFDDARLVRRAALAKALGPSPGAHDAPRSVSA